MPKVNVYLPDELADAVRATGVPVSSVCQRALEAAVREVRDAKLDPEVVPALERFTDRSRKVVAFASAAAVADDADLGSEHVLIGLLREGSGVAAHALMALGISTEAVVEATHTVSSTADGREVYRAALKEAFKLGHNYVGTEHLLLAIAASNCTARDVLSELGATASAVRHQVISILTDANTQSKSKQSPAGDVSAKLDEVLRRLNELEQRLVR
jgi:ATP-dependent Clp protease ATP-binding subunit ClpC